MLALMEVLIGVLVLIVALVLVMSLIVRNRAYVFEMSNQSYGEDQIRTKEGRAGIYMKKDAIGSSRSSE